MKPYNHVDINKYRNKVYDVGIEPILEVDNGNKKVIIEYDDYDEFKYIVDKVDVMEDNIDKTQHQFTVNQLIRLKEKKCSTENSIIYTKILTDFERIGDHGLNIAESLYHIRKIMKQMKMIKPEIEE